MSRPSGWTGLGIRHYICRESVPAVPLHVAARRPVARHVSLPIAVDEDRAGSMETKRREGYL